MVIRRSAPDDAAELDALIDSVAAEGLYLAGDSGFGEAETKRFIEYCLDGGYPQLVAVENGRIVGWCDVVPDARRGHGRLGIGVAKAYRGKGYGKALLEAGLEAGFVVFRVIELAVRADNTRATALYRSFGFREYRRLKPMALAAPSRGRIVHMRLKQ